MLLFLFFSVVLFFLYQSQLHVLYIFKKIVGNLTLRPLSLYLRISKELERWGFHDFPPQ